MKSLLNTGLLSIANISLNNNVLYIRPRGESDLDTVVSGFVYGNNKCILHTEDGCMLNRLFRPSEGLLLVPYDEHHFGDDLCISYYDTKRLISDWKKYQSILLELKKIYSNKVIYKNNPTKKDIEKFENKILRLK